MGVSLERRSALGGAVVVLVGGLAVLHRLGRTAGSTPAERQSSRPGDDLVAEPRMITDHAITIDAPPSAVWPWLAQMGWHRGGWYTARWVDRLLFPANDPSADVILPDLQVLEVGDVIPDGPPESSCGFVVAEVAPGRHLVLHSTEHLPLSWRRRFGARIDWTWAFLLDDRGDGSTRFAFRTRAALAPRWVAWLYQLLLVPADFVMAGQMLRGVKARAEGRPPRCRGHG